jgi:superfamily II DNA or RNA helicase
MGTLGELLGALSPDPHARGREFEAVAKWFLENDPAQRDLFRRVWLWKKWPGNWGDDEAGIDLVAERMNGDLVAVQVKCYRADRFVSKRDMDTFLSESSREIFESRLVIATCDVGRTARRTLRGQQKPVHSLLLDYLTHSPVDWPTSLDRLRPWKPKPAKPWPHQQEAVRLVVKGFASADRGQLIMACGTGKTRVGLLVAEAMDANRTLVLLPSLSLVSQTVREWKTNNRRGFEFLCVCSDDTVVGDDEMVSHVADLPFSAVTTDPAEVAAFLRKRGPRVVFSTYQSSPRVATAQALARVAAFDLAIADEAHRCAGKVDANFGTILDAAAIKARKRLFATATPRIASGSLKRAAADFDLEIASMDDPTVFGEVLYKLTFPEAINRDLLSDYQVAVVFVDDETARDYVERRVFLETNDGRVRDARTLAAEIGLAKAMTRYRLRRVVTFHSRVKLAADFAHSFRRTVELMPDLERPKGKIWAEHVSGVMPSGYRDRLLTRLRVTGANERALLANARCLTEGVDVPTLDGVAFIDPRRSQVEIVQAVGRAIRKSEGKKIGTVVLPLFLPSDVNADSAISATMFEPVVQVLRALRDHDEDLANELDELSMELGRLGTIARLPSKIKIIAPTHLSADFIRAFEVRTVELSSERWDFWLGLLQRFVEREGHTLVPQTYRLDGLALGQWVSHQRVKYREARLSNEHVARLETVPGWSWSPLVESWEESFARLEQFVEKEGHAVVPRSPTFDDFRLGAWVSTQRRNCKLGILDADRIERLKALPGWSWDAKNEGWERNFSYLERFVEQEGHARVPSDYELAGFQVGGWVVGQRRAYLKGRLPSDRIERLKALPGWIWASNDSVWEDGFAHLQRFVKRMNHARVPQGSSFDDYPLGGWVATQRRAYRRGQLLPNRIERLKAVPGWTWAPHDSAWEDGFAHLQRFVKRMNHAQVPRKHREEDGYPLGSWVHNRRYSYRTGALSADKIASLDTIPGWSWQSRKDSLPGDQARTRAPNPELNGIGGTRHRSPSA